MPEQPVIPDVGHYDRLAAKLSGSPEDRRDHVAHEHGFRTWWRLLAVIDSARTVRDTLPCTTLPEVGPVNAPSCSSRWVRR